MIKNNCCYYINVSILQRIRCSEFKNSDDDVDTSKYNEYKIKLMEDMKERITYTINFTLSKVEDKWIVDDLTETERSKIHGLYAY